MVASVVNPELKQYTGKTVAEIAEGRRSRTANPRNKVSRTANPRNKVTSHWMR